MVRERCSCGAEFESDDSQAVRLLRQWRKEHVCVTPAEEYKDAGTSMSSTETVGEASYPELRIGFRGDEDWFDKA